MLLRGDFKSITSQQAGLRMAAGREYFVKINVALREIMFRTPGFYLLSGERIAIREPSAKIYTRASWR